MKKSKLIPVAVISMVLLSLLYGSVFAEGITIDYGTGQVTSDGSSQPVIPGSMTIDYNTGTVSIDSGIRIEVGSQMDPTPAPAQNPAQTPAAPAKNSTTSTETRSVEPSKPLTAIPPPPEVSSQEEWKLDVSVDTSSLVADPSQLFASSMPARSIGMDFFAENWWWIVGCTIALLGLIIAVIIRRSK